MSTKLKQFPPQSLQVRLAFDQWLPRPVASLLERAGGPRTIGLHAWYRHSNEDAWSSFKVRSRNDSTAYYCYHLLVSAVQHTCTMMVYNNEIIFPGLNPNQKSRYWFLGFHPCDHFQQLSHNRSWCCTGVCVAAIGLWELQILAGHCRCCSLVQLADLLRIYWFLRWIWWNFIQIHTLNFVSFRFKAISFHSCNPKTGTVYIYIYVCIHCAGVTGSKIRPAPINR